MAKSKPPGGPAPSVLFYRVAVHRFEEAEFLLDHSPYTTAAVYLAGYAVECGLKAVILASEPRSRNAKTLATFRGVLAHDYEWLRRQIQRRNVTVPVEVSRQLSHVSWWNTDLRYQAGRVQIRGGRRTS
jgi:hypothetical protein